MNKEIDKANRWIVARRRWERNWMILALVVIVIQWCIVIPSIYFTVSNYTLAPILFLTVIVIAMAIVGYETQNETTRIHAEWVERIP